MRKFNLTNNFIKEDHFSMFSNVWKKTEDFLHLLFHIKRNVEFYFEATGKTKAFVTKFSTNKSKIQDVAIMVNNTIYCCCCCLATHSTSDAS